jgi:hypothetical protein
MKVNMVKVQDLRLRSKIQSTMLLNFFLTAEMGSFLLKLFTIFFVMFVSEIFCSVLK